MEQNTPMTGRSLELPPVSSPDTKEQLGSVASPEVQTGSAVERQERKSETVAAADLSANPPMTLPPLVTSLPVVDDTTVTTPLNSDLPSVASDDELIEKEWVNKAKEIIAKTKDDPYLREKEVGRIQADYLSKRYGRKLGPPTEGA